MKMVAAFGKIFFTFLSRLKFVIPLRNISGTELITIDGFTIFR